MQFRKKPVTIEAQQLSPTNASAIAEWINRNGGVAAHVGKSVEIKTLEGTMRAEVCDWIIRGVAGEFYPCKPGIFASTYNAEPETVDQAHERLGNTAPRVTPADLEANIAAEYFVTGDAATKGSPQHEALRLLTICIVVTRNGFVEIGTSAPASPENFNAELGRKFARENVLRKLWPLMGYALRDRLHDREQTREADMRARDREALARGGIVDHDHSGDAALQPSAAIELTDHEHLALGHEWNAAERRWFQPENETTAAQTSIEAPRMTDDEHRAAGHVYVARLDEWQIPGRLE